MTTEGLALVGGETVADLANAVQDVSSRPARNGMSRLQGTFGPAFVRALMRIEAELLLADADAWPIGPDVDRTPEQRRADAFVELASRLAPHLAPPG